MSSALTTATQSCNALIKAVWFWMVWSAGVITKIGSASATSFAWKAAKVKAGAVLRPTGSSNKVAWISFNSRNWSSTKKRCSSLVTISVEPNSIEVPLTPSWRSSIALIRWIACWNKLWLESSPESTKNCFGNPDRDKGQRRVPEPPHRMTGITEMVDLAFVMWGWAKPLCFL